MNLLRDKKVITGSTGYNVLRPGLIWGEFTITRDGAEIVLTYDKMPIVDRMIRVDDDDHLKGQFYLQDKFVGDFEMARVLNIA